MIGERKQSILEMLVREYIKTAEPVSSEKIAKRMKGALSSASIRNIFSELTEEGFIEQPHISGGRVPKAQGYRFFVDRVMSNERPDLDIPSEILRAFESLEENMHMLREAQEEMARHMHVISRFGSLMPVGFHEMFSERDFFEDTDAQHDLGQFLDEFEDYRGEYAQALAPDSFDVMIGEENGIQPMRRISVVVGKNSDEDLFFIAGPMRMPYHQIITLMNVWKKKPTTTKKKI